MFEVKLLFQQQNSLVVFNHQNDAHTHEIFGVGQVVYSVGNFGEELKVFKIRIFHWSTTTLTHLVIQNCDNYFFSCF